MIDVTHVQLQVPRQDIGRLCSLVEGYEGVAVVRTVDPALGLVELLVAPAFHDTALRLLHAIAQDIPLRILDPGNSAPAPCGPTGA